jgi:hypothetical protein
LKTCRHADFAICSGSNHFAVDIEPIENQPFPPPDRLTVRPGYPKL